MDVLVQNHLPKQGRESKHALGMLWRFLDLTFGDFWNVEIKSRKLFILHAQGDDDIILPSAPTWEARTTSTCHDFMWVYIMKCHIHRINAWYIYLHIDQSHRSVMGKDWHAWNTGRWKAFLSKLAVLVGSMLLQPVSFLLIRPPFKMKGENMKTIRYKGDNNWKTNENFNGPTRQQNKQKKTWIKKTQP